MFDSCRLTPDFVRNVVFEKKLFNKNYDNQ